MPQADGPYSHDGTRRTLLAVERTALAWWRTGLALLTVALACARVIPELSDADHQWPYTLLGAIFAVLGILCVAYGERRRRHVEAAVRRNEFVANDPRWMALLAVLSTVAGVGLLAIVILAP